MTRITRARIFASSMVRTAGTATTKRKTWGPTQMVAARMCSQGLTASGMTDRSALPPDRLLPLRPHRDDLDGAAQQRLDALHVGLGLSREVAEAAHAGDVLPPARVLLEERPHALQ